MVSNPPEDLENKIKQKCTPTNEIEKVGLMPKSILTINYPMVLSASVCSHWITVIASCDKKYYLCADNYENIEDLTETINYFDDAKCEE